MESLPPELISFIQQVRPLFRAEVFDSFCYLMMGLLIGDAKQGTVRSSVFAPAGFWPQRLSARRGSESRLGATMLPTRSVGNSDTCRGTNASTISICIALASMRPMHSTNPCQATILFVPM
jgi:hypothetical protein